MTSAFDGAFDATAVGPMFARFGASATVTHTSADGVETAVSVMLGPLEMIETDSEYGRQARRSRLCAFRTDPDSDQGGVSAPHVRDRLSIADDTWSVESIEAQSAGLVVCRIVAISSMERSRRATRQGG